MVGREDGVFFFSCEDRGGAAGFEGKKQHVGCLWNYILVRGRNGMAIFRRLSCLCKVSRMQFCHVSFGERMDIELEIASNSQVFSVRKHRCWGKPVDEVYLFLL